MNRYLAQQHSAQINRSSKRQFTHIPISLSQVFYQLKETNVITCETPKPGYRPWNANPNSQCDYHMGQKGHSTDSCWRLKDKIQDLIDIGLIQFDEMPTTGNNSPWYDVMFSQKRIIIIMIISCLEWFFQIYFIFFYFQKKKKKKEKETFLCQQVRVLI